MAHTNSPLGQLTAVVPDSGEPPDVAADLLLLAAAVEKKLNMRYASRTARNAAITSPEDGMVTYIEDVDEVDLRTGGSWKKIWPVIYSGSSAPSSAVGSVGDVYMQHSYS